MFKAIIDGNLAGFQPGWKKKATVCKYVVPVGYGVKSEGGHPLEVDEKAIAEAGAKLFYASVDLRDDGLYTGTSRSLAVVGIGDNLSEAEEKAETALEHVNGHIFMRHDIGTPEAIQRKISRLQSIRGQ